MAQSASPNPSITITTATTTTYIERSDSVACNDAIPPLQPEKAKSTRSPPHQHQHQKQHQEGPESSRRSNGTATMDNGGRKRDTNRDGMEMRTGDGGASGGMQESATMDERQYEDSTSSLSDFTEDMYAEFDTSELEIALDAVDSDDDQDQNQGQNAPSDHTPVAGTEALLGKRKRDPEDSPQLGPRKQRDKPVSPPWKRIEAEGPTSFTENGRRKSGRINTHPLQQLQSPQAGRRLTRGTLTSHDAHNSQPERLARHQPNGSNLAPTRNGTREPPAKPMKAPQTRLPARRASQENKEPGLSRSSRHRPTTSSPSRQPTRYSTRTRRARPSLDDEGEKTVASEGPKRIKLHVKLTTLPLLHPKQVDARPKSGLPLEEYWARAGQIPVDEGGLLLPEDGPQYTDDQARHDAKMIHRVEHEINPGGLLTAGHCSVFAPEPEEELPRQWAHHDHMVKAAANLRKLMLAERQRHRITARKLAESCRDRWLQSQPKSAEELEREEQEMSRAKYKLLVRTLAGTWENVRIEVNRRRLERWEAEEQKRVKAALNEAVNLSEMKLQARWGGQVEDEEGESLDGMDMNTDEENASSQDSEDEDEDEDEDDIEEDDNSDDDGDDDDNMSLSDDEAESEMEAGNEAEAADAQLTQAQLREKYANLPPLVSNSADAAEETSDESVDMEDDLGSSDEKSDGSGKDGSEEESDGESSGLLGLFFENSELKKLREGDGKEMMDGETVNGVGMGIGDQKGHKVEDNWLVEDNVAMAAAVLESAAQAENTTEDPTDEDEVSLIQHPDDIQVVTSSPAVKPAAPSYHLGEEGHDGAPVVNGIPLSNGIAKNRNDAVPHLENAQRNRTPKFNRNVKTFVPMAETLSPTSRDVDMTILVKTDEVTSHDGLFDDGNGTHTKPSYAIDTTYTTDSTTAPIKPHNATIASDLHNTLDNNQNNSENKNYYTKDVIPHISDVESDKIIEDRPTPPDQKNRKDHLSFSPSSPLATSLVTTPIEQTVGPRPRIEIPFLLRGTLREYQHDGLDWLAGLYANETNGILADEMGLGKTIQTIALLAHLACQHEVWGPHLVIVPTSVMLNWEMEFKKWCPGFKILAYYGSQDERKRKRFGWTNDDNWNVCITSYQLVLQDQQVFKRRRWHYMILDEAHNIKNFKSQRWQTLLGFNARSRLLLTGTPLQNNLTELWSLLFFLMPAENGEGGFADLQEFHDWFRKPESQILESGREKMDDEARALIAKLHKVLRPYLLRRLKADVEKQMPAKYEHVELCRLSKRQRELYDGFLARSDTRQTLESGNYLSIINCLMQLRKVCNHPDLFIDRPIMTSFRVKRSVPMEYWSSTETLVRRRLLSGSSNPALTAESFVVNLDFLNLVPARHEAMSSVTADSISRLSAHRQLVRLRDAQAVRLDVDKKKSLCVMSPDPETTKSNVAYLEGCSRKSRLSELRHCVYVNVMRRQRRPVYGKNLIDMLTIGADGRLRKPWPKLPKVIASWFEEESRALKTMMPTVDERARSLESTIAKFACVTPTVAAGDMSLVMLGRGGVEQFEAENARLCRPVRWAPFLPEEVPADPWHEARMRLSIQFPDKRLLQYDCGKLQALDRLLRRLEAGGHRALIFTQMTKVLDILEQFLNMHGHKYLRLDGATKVEQRQILTDRFNHDARILAFILSTRSGGLGINLTGADTVIFYDQDWNPAMDKQCQDRCHRIGQTRDVHIYRLVSEHTIEANILRKATQKQILDDVVIQEGEFTTEFLSSSSSNRRPPAVAEMMMSERGRTAGLGSAAASEAVDRVLGVSGVNSGGRGYQGDGLGGGQGGNGSEGQIRDIGLGRVLEAAEDREDVAAAKAAEKEETQADAADFYERPSRSSRAARADDYEGVNWDINGTAPGAGEGPKADPHDSPVEHNAWDGRMGTIDDYMLAATELMLDGTPLEIPRDKKRGKKKKGKDTRKR